MGKPPSLDSIHKKQRQALRSMCNSIATAFSFKQLKTWEDVYRKKGESDEAIKQNYTLEQRAKEVLYPALKIYFKELEDRLEERFKGEVEAQAKPILSEPANESRQDRSDDAVESRERVADSKILEEKEPKSPVANYGLPRFPELEKNVFLFWFQKKAVKDALDKLLGFDVSICKTVDDLRTEFEKRGRKGHMRGFLLLSGTGTGKTFMVAGTVAYLKYIGFADDKTFGPIEYLYVTRASIVEQTKRVFAKSFKLRQEDGVEVLNIEQLRSRGGELWLTPETQVLNGEEVINWKWRRGLWPVVILLDECQSVKNDGTTQSQIIQNFADIKSNDTHMIFVSATPFTRVSEAKSFVINAGVEDNSFL